MTFLLFIYQKSPANQKPEICCIMKKRTMANAAAEAHMKLIQIQGSENGQYG